MKLKHNTFLIIDGIGQIIQKRLMNIESLNLVI